MAWKYKMNKKKAGGGGKGRRNGRERRMKKRKGRDRKRENKRKRRTKGKRKKRKKNGKKGKSKKKKGKEELKEKECSRMAPSTFSSVCGSFSPHPIGGRLRKLPARDWLAETWRSAAGRRACGRCTRGAGGADRDHGWGRWGAAPVATAGRPLGRPAGEVAAFLGCRPLHLARVACSWPGKLHAGLGEEIRASVVTLCKKKKNGFIFATLYRF